ncbi:hypothetical protein M407DRAFT_241551 [Tulasnella calospora MUT 4182]|uniref:Uncharacterized protein n=1 Tax=Tulasnella calospora MUT 4182 TaxID=1051891 RepID=A0A0C3QSS6_9AGAM|nr:hypothetical protein M407DRAFT_241551 [Tulasnella calospora MUT 4182]
MGGKWRGLCAVLRQRVIGPSVLSLDSELGVAILLNLTKKVNEGDITTPA